MGDNELRQHAKEVCPDCGLPKDICVCSEIFPTEKLWRARYHELVIALERLLREAKAKDR